MEPRISRRHQRSTRDDGRQSTRHEHRVVAGEWRRCWPVARSLYRIARFHGRSQWKDQIAYRDRLIEPDEFLGAQTLDPWRGHDPDFAWSSHGVGRTGDAGRTSLRGVQRTRLEQG